MKSYDETAKFVDEVAMFDTTQFHYFHSPMSFKHVWPLRITRIIMLGIFLNISNESSDLICSGDIFQHFLDKIFCTTVDVGDVSCWMVFSYWQVLRIPINSARAGVHELIAAGFFHCL